MVTGAWMFWLRMARPVLLCLALLPLGAAAQPVTVFAAASLSDALGDVARLWREAGHDPTRFSFAASSTLARQIEQGAPADLFASADERWMDELAQRGLIAEGTRKDLLGNSLVLIVPASHSREIELRQGADLAGLLGPDGRLAVGDPAHVPAGLYAEQALRNLGLWSQVSARLARAEDVRAALLLVERGECPAGIVYATDAKASPAVRIAGVFPASTHQPIVYPFALTKSGDKPEARAFLSFLQSSKAREVFVHRGFEVK
jgi:molybdate transport system substrate-binding protein